MIFNAVIVVVAVVIGAAIFFLSRSSGGKVLLSLAAGLIGATLFLTPILGGVFVGPLTLSQASFIGMSVAVPYLTGLIAIAAGLIGVQELLDPDRSLPATLWPQKAMIAAVGLGLLSLLWHWLVREHCGPRYLDVMWQGWSYLAALAALIWAVPKIAVNRAVLYALLLCLIGGAGVASGMGTQDFLMQLREHVAEPRENGTAVNPDFFACFLVTTLPLSLALWLSAPSGDGKRFGLLYALAFLLQVVMLPLTQSRFALIAAPIGFLVFVIAYFAARRRGMPSPPALKSRLIVLGAIVLIGLAVASRSILHRLQAGMLESQAHSGAFRIWTWKGEARLIKDHPILGTGPGTFDYAYPHYALVGFVQHAHNSYLQIAGDIGIPALLCVLAAFGGALALGMRAISKPPRAEEEPEPIPATSKKKGRSARQEAPQKQAMDRSFLEQVAAPDDRWVLAGALGGLAAGLIQNLIDSNVFLFFNGVTLISLMGVILALSRADTEPAPEKARRPLLLIGTAVCAVVGAGMIWIGIATSYAAGGDYQTAQSMMPLNGTFTSLLGWRVYLPQGRIDDAKQMLTRATELAPDGVSFNHVGDSYLFTKQPDKALAAFEEGLAYDPNSLELLLKAAQTADGLGRHGDALATYGKMMALQQGPYAHILAVTEVTEYRYAYADSAVGDQALAENRLPAALSAYQAAQRVLETYAAEGGSRNIYRMVQNNNKANPDLDQSLLELYEHVTGQMERVYEKTSRPDQAAALQARAASYAARFSAPPH